MIEAVFFLLGTYSALTTVATMRFLTIASLLAAAAPSLCCDDCYGPHNMAAHVRNVRRMQPGAPNATSGPRAPLEWGQINFMHTTDTHGWLEGHLKEQNYGADWGDFVTFSRHMQHKAGNLGVDLLLVGEFLVLSQLSIPSILTRSQTLVICMTAMDWLMQ